MLPTPPLIDQWRQRLDDLLRENRQSEAEYLHDWMDVAFGRDHDQRPAPLDLHIHTRLADLYLKAKKYQRGIGQLELARQLAPRDIFILHKLGRAYLENQDHEKAKAVIDLIARFDSKAFVHNTECAGLAGRWHREKNDLQAAADVYAAALDANPDSYYLANLLGEVRVEAHDLPSAQKAFRRALDILQRLHEVNIWTFASSANAHFVLGEDDAARACLAKVRERRPDAGSLDTIEDGLKKLANGLENGGARLSALLAALR